MRMAVAVIAMLYALPPLGDAVKTARAQTVTIAKAGVEEKARKIKTFPVFTDLQLFGHAGVAEYKMTLSATDVVSATGKRTGFVTLRIMSAADGVTI